MHFQVQKQHQILFHQALSLHQSGQHQRAKEICQKLTRIYPRNPEVWRLRSAAEYGLGELEASIASLRQTLAFVPDHAESQANIAHLLDRIGRLTEAVPHYEKATQLDPKNLKLHLNRGNCLCKVQRYQEALMCYARVLQLDPNHFSVYHNQGVALNALGRLDEAVASYDKAIAHNPAFVQSYVNKGESLVSAKRLEDGLACYQQALSIDPEADFLLGRTLYTRQMLADWNAIEAQIEASAEKAASGLPALTPFDASILVDSPQLQLKVAEIYAKIKHPPSNVLPALTKYASHDRIRIGYFSSDFGDHPVTHLLAGLLEKHDRSKFEIFAFSYGAERSGSWRDRVIHSVDEFLDVRLKSEMEIVTCAREREIDIAVNLNGYTGQSINGIFVERVAPVQVSYIGFLGTMGASYMDYLIADPVIVPERNRNFYSEKIVSLASYQCNDDTQTISEKPMTKADFGLPDNAFVFCSFNNNYKITKEVFEIWMRLLNHVPGSVLWLYVENQTAIENYKAEAAKRGVDTGRLIFANRIPLDEHIARLKLADIFLDTHPYNAGATASNALRAGLPVLTRLGESFASRMGASLLHAVGLPELLTESPEEYEMLAIALAQDKSRLSEIRQKLAENLPACALFDTERFVRNIEAAYTAMYERSQNELPPDHIDVSVTSRV